MVSLHLLGPPPRSPGSSLYFSAEERVERWLAPWLFSAGCLLSCHSVLIVFERAEIGQVSINPPRAFFPARWTLMAGMRPRIFEVQSRS